MTTNLPVVNESYGFFSDFSTSFKRWFCKGYRSSLKGITLEHVLQGSTKQPISLYDFRMYLAKKEHTAENLDFHYWYQGYRKRFAALSTEMQATSPPPRERFSPNFQKDDLHLSDDDLKKHYPDEEQPFRKEVDIVLRTYFDVISLKELYVDKDVLKYTLYYAAETTHPDVFEPAYQQTYGFMSNTSFKNFIHVQVQNIRYPTIVGILTIGSVCFALCPMVAFNTFSIHATRWSRGIIFVFFLIFFSCVLLGRTGFCMIRGLSQKRQIPEYMEDEYIKDNKTKRFNPRVEIGNDIEVNKPSETSLVPVLDNEVAKYHRQMAFHICAFSLLVALAIGGIAVGITNENDPLPLVPDKPTNSTV